LFVFVCCCCFKKKIVCFKLKIHYHLIKFFFVVVADITPPTLSNIRITSDNRVAGYASLNSNIFVRFQSSETLTSLRVTVNNVEAKVDPDGIRSYVALVTINSTALFPKVERANYTITYSDESSNVGIPRNGSVSSDGTFVIIGNNYLCFFFLKEGGARDENGNLNKKNLLKVRLRIIYTFSLHIIDAFVPVILSTTLNSTSSKSSSVATVGDEVYLTSVLNEPIRICFVNITSNNVAIPLLSSTNTSLAVWFSRASITNQVQLGPLQINVTCEDLAGNIVNYQKIDYGGVTVGESK
jgi:hypothetical protein